MLKTIDEKLFEQIFRHTLETLANKLINTTNKEENQIIVKSINKNKNKLYKQQKGDYVIQPSDWRIDLINAINLILDFNKNENENVNENDNENENVNENDEKLMSSNKDDNDDDDDDHDDNEMMSQNEIKKIKWSFW